MSRFVESIKHSSFLRKIAEPLTKQPLLLYPLDAENMQRAEYARYLLGMDANKDKMLVVMCNHISHNDIPTALQVIARYIDPGLQERRTYMMVSDRMMGKKGIFKGFVNAAEWVGVSAISVVQSADIRELKERKLAPFPDFEDIEQRWRMIKDNLDRVEKTVDDIRASGIPSTLVLSPEGTRSKTGVMKSISQGKGDGISALIAQTMPAFILPLGLYFDQENLHHKRGFNLKRMHVNVGFPLIHVDGSPPTYTDVMTQIARLVPPHMRGDWGTGTSDI